ncbi:hypothetical protein ABZU76_13165 [Amycolatopsis sp. NPDC005232]|uniref:hypothetical protein n=1 Tax=Amycolatopsis sp. NPDC005232 TaxID=3157027 RepID=UPI0033AAD6DD
MTLRNRRGLWWLLATGLAAWAGSWRIIHLEVTRWHHLDSRLRFTPPPAPPGSPAPHAGLPVIMALAVAGAAPLVSIVVAVLLLARSSTKDNNQAAG